jgi:glutaredoxin 3
VLIALIAQMLKSFCLKIRVDGDSAILEEMIEKTGRRTVPQIYIGDYHVGGFDDLRALDLEGKLDPLLGIS